MALKSDIIVQGGECPREEYKEDPIETAVICIEEGCRMRRMRRRLYKMDVG